MIVSGLCFIFELLLGAKGVKKIRNNVSVSSKQCLPGFSCDFEIVVPPLFIKKTEIIKVNFERWCSSIADFGIIIVTSGLVASPLNWRKLG